MCLNDHNEHWRDRLRACLIGGAIGDAVGIPYEGLNEVDAVDFDQPWLFSDDTQLTLATCEAIMESDLVAPDSIAQRMLYWYNSGKLSGLGSSTLKALRELQVGGHWALVGRQGEYAAGNGAAMRVAPLAFKNNVDRFTLKDVCTITHKNDEAYAGALAIYTAISMALKGVWKGHINLLPLVIEELPDTAVKDRLIAINTQSQRSIVEIGKSYPATGYVVDSVPLALFAASKVDELGFYEVQRQLLLVGGDTDTNCSMAGQVMGSFGGMDLLPTEWKLKFSSMHMADTINRIVDAWKP